ncbi:MAG TPA: FAD-dependent oxidoreductase [Verrucomicrobiota bacterium]|mgnify:CR=1 FL=1|jgi:ferredoxin|nr:FAD-dependent oxidoreductase [Verrucomicrobiota bacterium]NMD20518.1 NAD(P)-binding protein [Verrucomicrobiota bacterium]HNU99013.1 FAD-dependent oxidoreductase [Verrucomicrobiota bacterium]HOA61295.1 FAD-dependent oxidoreductase [Verrucomicrobiota bacterium]HOF48964.1 FAD-dependent oxidoreductase [Verrucomicrobiota bacterium]
MKDTDTGNARQTSEFEIVIDGCPVTVREGETVLAGARRLGLDIPTLCYLPKCGPLTSCLVCLVKVRAEEGGGGRLVPSCGLEVQPGMVIESETDEVRTARRTALELLFSDHVGDCLAPCHRLCPLHLNIPVMLHQVETQTWDAATRTVLQALPMPAILGRLCHHPCENGCRRGTHDQPIAIRDVERLVADRDLASSSPFLPPRKPAAGKSVAIIGAGPTGLAAAFFLLREGHGVTIFDRHDKPGGSLRGEVDGGALESATLDAEMNRLRALGAQFSLGIELGRDETLEGLLTRFDAVLVAWGRKEKALASLALATTPTGIRADPLTAATSQARVFAAGAAVRPIKHLVRAMSEGRSAALAVHRSLLGLKAAGEQRLFSSVMGRLSAPELGLFLVGHNPAPRISPAQGVLRGFTALEGRGEAGRCLHCDCRAEGNCQLQHYGELYGVEPGRFRSQRRPFEQHLERGEIVFEPGKCILCGICVRITELAREPLGLTFIGRGFDVRVAAPLDRAIADGLQKVARECVEACPTGALAFKHDLPPPPRESA